MQQYLEELSDQAWDSGRSELAWFAQLVSTWIGNFAFASNLRSRYAVAPQMPSGLLQKGRLTGVSTAAVFAATGLSLTDLLSGNAGISSAISNGKTLVPIVEQSEVVGNTGFKQAVGFEKGSFRYVASKIAVGQVVQELIKILKLPGLQHGP